MRLIDADAFIERLKKDPLFPLVERYGLTSVIYTQKTVDPVQHGRWVDKYGDGDWHCTCCGAIVEKHEQDYKNWYFCYHCGAKMDEVEE